MSSSSPNYSADKAAMPDTGGLEVVRSDDLPQVVEGFKMKPAEYGEAGAATGTGGEKRVCGMQRSTFILAVLLAVVVVAAAVGGGVGGSMAVSKAYDRGFTAAEAELTFSAPDEDTPASEDDPSETSDPEPEPSQSGRIELPPAKGHLPLDCPNLDGKTRKIKGQNKEHNFRLTCGADSAPGEGARNIMTLTAYRFADCMRACATLNERGNVGKGKVCGAVRFHMDLAFVGSHGGNCWLKKGFDALVFDKNDKTKNNHIFAELQD